MISETETATRPLLEAWVEAERTLTMTFDPAEKASLYARQQALEVVLLQRSGSAPEGALPGPARTTPRAGRRRFRIVIVGAGLGGLCMGARLAEAAFDDFVILEKAEDLGGTWHYNRYPGAACDVASPTYCLPFFPNPDWTQKSASGAEIKAYLQSLADHYRLRDRIRFRCTVTRCVYVQGVWEISTDSGESVRADVLITATGLLHVPRYPTIAGLDRFDGKVFHSSEWPQELCVDGLRVGILGTGSSGVQIAPRIVDRVRRLSIFQRTAQWVFPMSNEAYPAQRRQLLRRYPELQNDVFDLHLQAFNATIGRAVSGDPAVQQVLEEVCRDHLRSVGDPGLRLRLTPPEGTRALCRRLVLSDEYYDAIQNERCELVTDGIVAVERQGVRTKSGRLHELDVLVLATGFDGHAYCRRLNISIAGGSTLEDVWADGARAHDSVAVAGFPNLFMVGGPYSPVGNLSTMICSQLEADYIIRLLGELEARHGSAIVARHEAEDGFVAWMQEAAPRTTWASGCQNWYLDERGKLDMWTRSPEEYIGHLNARPRFDEYRILHESTASGSGLSPGPCDVLMPAGYAARGAARQPDRAATVFRDHALSYSELELAARAFTSWSAERGVVAGDRIAYLGRNSDVFIIVFLGCMQAGIVLVPINWRHAAPEIAFVLEDSSARLLIADTEFASAASSAMTDRPVPIFSTDRSDASGLPAGLSAFESTLRLAHDSARPANFDAPALLCYTSGTTGKPKGVQLSQRAFAMARQMELESGAYADWCNEDIVLAAMPLFHIGGMSWALGALRRGLTCVIAQDASPATMLDLCGRHAVSRLFAVPSSIRSLVEAMQSVRTPLPSIRGIHYGAAPMDPELLRLAMAQFRCRFVQHFGMTETCGCGTLLAPDDHDPANPQWLRSVGSPLPGVTVEIRNPQTRTPCPTQEHGEIWIKGPMILSGYAGRPAETADAVHGEWYRTGDGGYFDAGGRLYLTDRIKDMIISGGENVYPREVEEVLCRHPAVADAAVFGVSDQRWGERVVAAIELRAGAQPAPEELAAHARQFLAGYKVPRQFEIQQALPRTASGKVQRNLARARHLQNAGAAR